MSDAGYVSSQDELTVAAIRFNQSLTLTQKDVYDTILVHFMLHFWRAFSSD